MCLFLCLCMGVFRFLVTFVHLCIFHAGVFMSILLFVYLCVSVFILLLCECVRVCVCLFLSLFTCVGV